MRVGSWAEAAKPRQQWRPTRLRFTRQHGSGSNGTCRWKALRVWETAALVRRLWKRPSVLLERVGESRFRKAARQRVPVARSRGLRRGPKSQAQVMPAPARRRAARMGSDGSWSQLVSTAPTVSPLEAGDAVRGYPALSWKAPFRRLHKRASQGGGGGSDSRKGASPSLVSRRIPRVPVDNKSAAEIG
jgi:hypothetical protein